MVDRFRRALVVVAVTFCLLALAAVPAVAVDEPTPAPEPTPEMITLTGTVVGADGAPIEVRKAYAVEIGADDPDRGLVGPAAGFPIEVADDGSFAVAVYAWGTKEDPAHLRISVYGPLTGREVEGDCEYQLGLYGEWQADVALAEGGDPSPITVVVDREVRVGGGCAGSTVEPGPTDDPGATGEPTPTDEPTPEPTPIEPLIVVEDATVIVAVVHAEDGSPAVRATVLLSVVDTHGDGSLVADYETTTDASGQATFDGVARPGEGGRPFVWRALASTEASTSVEGCLLTYLVTAEAEVDAVAGTTEIGLDLAGPGPETVRTSECDPPVEGAPVLTGTVVSPEGHGLEVTRARYLQQRADGASWGGDFEVAADGSFSIALQAWGTWDAVSVLQVEVAANRAETTTPEGCTETTEDVGTIWRKLALAEAMPLEPVELVLETQGSGACGAVGTPRPEPGATDDGAGTGGTTGGESDDEGQAGAGEGGTRDTLPPTDRPGLADASNAPPAALLTLVLVIALAVMLAASAAREPRRRR
ncbi:MAG: hypothetical protein A2X23_07785 [Chloroflexi bacterium GWC2_73_18]|nr:MAG: hypothetical protein A2X23_07785 [Chloroflexi bacterium GWC2_73_18]